MFEIAAPDCHLETRQPSNISFLKCPSVCSSTLMAKGHDDGAHRDSERSGTTCFGTIGAHAVSRTPGGYAAVYLLSGACIPGDPDSNLCDVRKLAGLPRQCAELFWADPRGGCLVRRRGRGGWKFLRDLQPQQAVEDEVQLLALLA